AIAALSVGLAQACLDEAVNYAQTRKQFGQPIGKFQAIQFKLADMDTEIELARLMYYKAAWLHMQGKPYTREASMAKLFASEVANRACRRGTHSTRSSACTICTTCWRGTWISKVSWSRHVASPSPCTRAIVLRFGRIPVAMHASGACRRGYSIKVWVATDWRGKMPMACA
ncbi:MAG: acyl-CoA dehydrogenase family protein, partial [Rudaea sp.]